MNSLETTKGIKIAFYSQQQVLYNIVIIHGNKWRNEWTYRHQVWMDVNTNMDINPSENCGRADLGFCPCCFAPGVRWLSGSARAAVLPFCSHHLPVIPNPVGIFYPPKCSSVCVCVVSLSHHLELSGAWCLYLCAMWSVRVSVSSAAITASLELLQLFHWDFSACLLVEFVTGDFLCDLMSL